jgi:beta-lactamase superfamily II metal-dependent hydrolase
VKIRAFHAKDGDCLLIRGDDDTVILADGGRSAAFTETIASRLTPAKLGTDIDLVYVSHIDNDHLSGILELVKTKVAWEVHDFHGGDWPRPKLPRPAAVQQIWHNGFAELVDDRDGTIERALDLATRTLSLNEPAYELFERYENLTTGVKDTLELNYRLRFGGMESILNQPSAREDGLLLLSSANERHTVGEFEVRILGPTVKELEALRVFWNEWLERNNLDVPAIREAAEEESRALGTSEEQALLSLLLRQAEGLGEGSEGVTEPNVASLTLLVEEGSRKVLLTGDARSEELLAGLRQHGLVTDDSGLHVDVLKVQHHGAAGNVTEEFAKLVTADHYIFCANGSHSNPEKAVLKGLLDFRIGERASENLSPGRDRPFTFWFTTKSDTPGITSGQKTFLKSVESYLSEEWDDEPGFTRKYPKSSDPFSIEIEI